MKNGLLVVLGILVVIMLLCGSALHAQGPQILTIDEAVETALDMNPSVQAVRDVVIARVAGLRGARAAWLPEVGVAVEYRRITSPPTFTLPSPDPEAPPVEITAGAGESVVGTLSVEQPVYTGGRIPAGISRSEALLDLAMANLMITESQLALQVREAYHSVLLGNRLVLTADQSLAATQAQLDAATARFEIGTAPQFDVLWAQTQVSEAEQELVEARSQVEISRVTLNRLLGVRLDAVFRLTEPEIAPVPAQDIASMVAIARRERGEVVAARAQVEAAESGIRLAEADLRPQVGATASYIASTEDVAVQPTGLILGVFARMELFDGGRRQARIDESRALRDEAASNLEEATRAVDEDVRRASLRLLAILQTIETARTRVTQTEEAYEIALVRYEAGVGTAIEIAEALAMLTAARTNLDRAIFNYNIAYADLQRALGRVTFPMDETTPDNRSVIPANDD